MRVPESSLADRVMSCVAFSAKAAAAVVFFGLLVWTDLRLASRRLPAGPTALLPALTVRERHPTVEVPGRLILAEVARYDDELFAYLMAGYLRRTRALRNCEVLLTYSVANDHLAYSIRIHPAERDIPSALFRLYSAAAGGLIADPDWRLVDQRTLAAFRRQDRIFEMAYNFPVRRHLEQLKHAEIVAYASRFVRFKSASDPRTWRRNSASLTPLASAQARQLAADIVTVAEFFSLPVEFFFGIGAMENNYMNAAGDQDNTRWKRRADPGDIVLKRAGGRVLVRNPSQGLWQITRETLRRTHELYLADRHDYVRMPPALRPPQKLDLNHVDSRVLTTYAGLLFRELLDRCGGDVDMALGAYNGGLRNPNMVYARGVRAAAEHARNVMEQAALLGGPVACRQFLEPALPRLASTGKHRGE